MDIYMRNVHINNNTRATALCCGCALVLDYLHGVQSRSQSRIFHTVPF